MTLLLFLYIHLLFSITARKRKFNIGVAREAMHNHDIRG